MKTLFLLVVGLAGGYYYGFHDAQTHTRPVVSRVVDAAVHRTGGSNRGRYTTDVDGQMSRAER